MERTRILNRRRELPSIKFLDAPPSPPPFLLIPALNLLFLLLFLVVILHAYWERETILPLRLPLSSAGEDLRRSQQDLILHLDAEGRIFLEQNPISLPTLERRLRALVEFSQEGGISREPGVILRADQECRYRHIAAILECCVRASIRHLSLSFVATSPPTGEKGESEK